VPLKFIISMQPEESTFSAAAEAEVIAGSAPTCTCAVHPVSLLRVR
jgi:hypothetical protein